MASLVRFAARRQLASGSLMPLRQMHASQPLDPLPDQGSMPPPASASTVADPSASTSAGSSLGQVVLPVNSEHIHVRMTYLHHSTKTPPPVVRAGDQKTGRIRPVPQYIPLSRHVFGAEVRRDIIHASVIYTLDSKRQGTAKTKTRGEVAFSSRKIRPQKGSGSARLGSAGSPVLRKGGVAHGPQPRDMSSKLNRRVRELATRSALSLRWRTGDLHAVKSLAWNMPPKSTGPLARILRTRQWADCLVLTAPRGPVKPERHILSNKKPSAADPIYTEEQLEEHVKYIKPFILSASNIPRVEVIELHKLAEQAHEAAKLKPRFARKPGDRKKPGELHAYDILRRKKLICDLGAIEWLEEKFGGAIYHELDMATHAQPLSDAQLVDQLGEEVAAAQDEGTDAAVQADAELNEAAEQAEQEQGAASIRQEVADPETEAAIAEEERVMRDFDDSQKAVQQGDGMKRS